MRCRLLSVLVLICSLGVAPAAIAAGDADTTVHRSDLPTRADAAGIYPGLRHHQRSVARSSMIFLPTRRCVGVDVVAAGETGLVALYDGSDADVTMRGEMGTTSSRSQDTPVAALVSFARIRQAKRVMAKLDRFVTRCEGTTTHQATTQVVKSFPTSEHGDGPSVSFRSYVSIDGYDFYALHVFTRVGNVLLWTRVNNAERGPNKKRAQRFNALQVETRGMIAS